MCLMHIFLGMYIYIYVPKKIYYIIEYEYVFYTSIYKIYYIDDIQSYGTQFKVQHGIGLSIKG